MCNFSTVHEVCRSRGHKIFLPNIDGHEMFLNLFDGPQNIFLCSFVFLTLSKFIWKFKWVRAGNVETKHQERLRKIRHVQQEIKYFEEHD